MQTDTEKTKQGQTEQSNVIFVGKKPTMNYVLASVAQFTKVDTIVVKARGRAISTAVDVVEVLKNRFLPNLVVKDVKILTEEVPPRPRPGETQEQAAKRGNSKVSAIEITVIKQPF